jgi:hypothetical protein
MMLKVTSTEIFFGSLMSKKSSFLKLMLSISSQYIYHFDMWKFSVLMQHDDVCLRTDFYFLLKERPDFYIV